ncbi:YbaK/EbsC family protein [Mariniluteicoccus endophyticus]
MDTLPGNLDWKPLADALDLVAAPVAGAADGLDAYVCAIDATLADTATFCEAYAVDAAESANCVVVEGRRGDTTRLAAVMVLATDRADVNKVVKKHLGVRKVSFAPMDPAVGLTGMEHGGITPVGLPTDWPVLVDERVAAAGWVVIGGGVRGAKIAIRGGDLAALPGAEVLALAQ